MTLKFYKRGWSNEGILYRKGDYLILKPTCNGGNWGIRMCGGKVHCDFKYEFITFFVANKLIKYSLKK